MSGVLIDGILLVMSPDVYSATLPGLAKDDVDLVRFCSAVQE